MKPILFTVLLLSGCSFVSGPISPLVTAARSGNVAKINDLAASGADLNKPEGVNHWTPLLHAVHTNQVGSVQALLDKGAAVDLQGGGTTPLIMAAGYGYSDIVKVLLQHHADARAVARNGRTALAAALEGSSDNDHATAGQCQTETVRLLVAADRGVQVAEDSSAMQAARKSGCRDILAALGR